MRVERITVVDVENGKLVKWSALRPKSYEDPEFRAIRLARMRERFEPEELAEIKSRLDKIEERK